MKITFISDTHGKHAELTDKLPGGDILIHSGDFMNGGYDENEAMDFFDWIEHDVQGYEHKILIAGNHDRLFENEPEQAIKLMGAYCPSVRYLQDSSVKINGIKFYGSPHTPAFNNWAFNVGRNSDTIEEIWSKIPDDTDVLITHGPPLGMLDYTPYGGNVGCERLIYRVLEVQPLIHVFGHVHSSYGHKYNETTDFINASNLNEAYKLVNDPVNVVLDEVFKKVEIV
jgi:Icc-related predicted phosphoesterase